MVLTPSSTKNGINSSSRRNVKSLLNCSLMVETGLYIFSRDLILEHNNRSPFGFHFIAGIKPRCVFERTSRRINFAGPLPAIFFGRQHEFDGLMMCVEHYVKRIV